MSADRTLKRTKAEAALERAAAQRQTQRYVLRLYVAGLTPRSTRAIQNIRRI
jgi:circadian clock protein KaiB